ncbi:MAG TPA: G1 family glutamic endopeptidase [Mycobacteriales bacterium]|nr:G1 family glutamic endopeptidase [Mycobacteriales bacterium]
MSPRTIRSLVAALGAGAIAVSMAPAATAAGGVVNAPMQKTHARAVLPVHGGTSSSLNWGGYVVTPATQDVTSVKSTFVVPKATLVPPGFASTWTGIGGYNTSDLIQAGVTENSAASNALTGAQYGAWYEILPASETPLTNCTGNAACTVTPGAHVTVAITLVGTNLWDVSLADPTNHWTWDQQISYVSSESSAEWILEAPTVGAQTVLAGVGTVHFGPVSSFRTASGGAVDQTIAQGDPTLVDLSPGVVNEATPSPLRKDGQSFDVCSWKQSCA